VSSDAESSTGSEREPRALALAILGVALVAATWACFDGLRVVGFQAGSDEGIYREFLRRLHNRGPTVLPELFRSFIAEPERWTLPLPSRLGHLLLTWIASLFAGPTFEALSYVSAASFLLAIVANYALARRSIGELRAALVALGIACSPLLLRSSVQPLTDSASLLACSVSSWLFLELVARPCRATFLNFTAAFTFALLVKETALLLALPCAAMAWLERRRGGPRIRVGDLLVALGLPAAACVALWMLAAWSPTAPFQVLRIALGSLRHNEYVALHYGGPWFVYFVDFLLLSPLPVLLALTQLGRWPRLGPVTRAWAVFAAVLLLEAAFLGKNVRYFGILELPLRLLAVEGLFAVAAGWPRPRATAFVVASALVLAGLDLHDAVTTFRQVHDPIPSELLRLRGIVPGG
jgi:4-amino-4-deoxy-L-arabinose transferase-like glycosyltransferase